MYKRRRGRPTASGPLRSTSSHLVDGGDHAMAIAAKRACYGERHRCLRLGDSERAVKDRPLVEGCSRHLES